VVLSGGNIDSRVLASVLMRQMVRDRRVVRLLIELDDRPGQLALVSAVIGDAGANIIEVDHGRLFDDVSVRRTNLSVTVETRDHRHADAVVDALRAGGWTVAIG